MANTAIYMNFKRPTRSRDPGELHETITLCLDEIDEAEDNFDIILEHATSVSFFLSRVSSLDVGPLTELIRDLKMVFALTRRTMETQHGVRFAAGRQVAGKQAKPPARFKKATKDPYKCLCPLTVFLQLLAQSLSDIHFTRQDEWGSLAPLRNILTKMDAKIRSRMKARTGVDIAQGQSDCAGLARLFMFHERHGRYVVTATAPAYVRMVGLREYAIRVRDQYIASMWGGNPPAVVTDLLAYSEGIKAARQRRLDPINPPNVVKIRETIAGCNGSFHSSGNYHVACLVDCIRFEICRPRVAEELENSATVVERKAYPPGSCAEWELYNTLLHRPDPERPPPTRRPVTRKTANGAPKQETWDSHLPARPPSSLKGKEKSTTFGHNCPPRHSATSQFITPPDEVYRKPELLPTDSPEWKAYVTHQERQRQYRLQQSLHPQRFSSNIPPQEPMAQSQSRLPAPHASYYPHGTHRGHFQQHPEPEPDKKPQKRSCWCW